MCCYVRASVGTFVFVDAKDTFVLVDARPPDLLLVRTRVLVRRMRCLGAVSGALVRARRWSRNCLATTRMIALVPISSSRFDVSPPLPCDPFPSPSTHTLVHEHSCTNKTPFERSERFRQQHGKVQEVVWASSACQAGARRDMTHGARRDMTHVTHGARRDLGLVQAALSLRALHGHSERRQEGQGLRD